MAITRRLNDIVLTFDSLGNPTVLVTGVITDDVENTSTGAVRNMVAPAVLAAAATLRDAVMTVAANAGKPLSF